MTARKDLARPTQCREQSIEGLAEKRDAVVEQPVGDLVQRDADPAERRDRCPRVLDAVFEADPHPAVITEGLERRWRHRVDGVAADQLLNVAHVPVARILGAGTGLGQGFLIKQGNFYQAFPSEGGHADFAPRTEVEFQLLKYLLDKHDIQRISVERVVSGLGIVSIYQFLRDRKISNESPEIAEIVRTWEQEAGKRSEPAVVRNSRVAARAPRPVGRGRRQVASWRDAAARRRAASRRGTAVRRHMAGARVGAD